MRSFKGIFRDDISEFESHMPSHAVGLWASSRQVAESPVFKVMRKVREQEKPLGLRAACGNECSAALARSVLAVSFLRMQRGVPCKKNAGP